MEVRDHLRGLRGRVKQRQRDGGRMAPVLVARSAHSSADTIAFIDHVQVRQLGTLRLPGRARRVENDGRIIRPGVARVEGRLADRR